MDFHTSPSNPKKMGLRGPAQSQAQTQDPAQAWPGPREALALKKLTLFLDIFPDFSGVSGGSKMCVSAETSFKNHTFGAACSDPPCQLWQSCGVSAGYRISNPEASWSPQFQDKDLRPVHQRPRAQHEISHAKGPRPGEFLHPGTHTPLQGSTSFRAYVAALLRVRAPRRTLGRHPPLSRI